MQSPAEKTAERLYLALTTNDLDRFLGCCDTNAIFEFPFAPADRPQQLHGLGEVRSYLEPLFRRSQIVDMREWIVHQTTQPEKAVLEFTAVVQLQGDPVHFESRYIVVLTLQDGLISRYRDYWNPSPTKSKD